MVSFRSSWNPPPLGCLKLNCNASLIENSNSATFGGIIRDSKGAFVAAYNANYQNFSIAKAELCAVYVGLNTLSKLQHVNHVIVEIDSLHVFRLVQQQRNKKDGINPSNSFSLIRGIKDLMERDNWTVEICRVACEANQCAEVLAKRRQFGLIGVGFFDSVPDFLSHVYLTDMIKCRSSSEFV